MLTVAVLEAKAATTMAYNAVQLHTRANHTSSKLHQTVFDFAEIENKRFVLLSFFE